jgi:hypothetical protein
MIITWHNYNAKGSQFTVHCPLLAICVISRFIMAIFGKIGLWLMKVYLRLGFKVNISTHMIIWYDCILFEICLYGMMYGMNLLRAMIMWYDYILIEAIFMVWSYLCTNILCGIIDAVTSECIKRHLPLLLLCIICLKASYLWYHHQWFNTIQCVV